MQFIRSSALAVVVGMLMMPLATCNRTPEPGPTVVLESIEILYVELDNPVLARDAEGKPQKFNTSYMVRLGLKTSGVPNGPAFNIYVGKHRISELGGWKRGVYFHVYDPTLLKQLAGGEIFYRIGNEKPRSLDAKLDIGDMEDLPKVQEGVLFPNRKSITQDIR